MSETGLRRRLGAAVAGLEPGYFAFVMATGILSTGTLNLGLPWISFPLLPIAAGGYVVLCLLTVWRLVGYPRRVLADASQAGRAFAFFTFVAAGDVLGVRFSIAGLRPLAIVPMAISAAAWLVLSYGLVARLATVPGKRGLGDSVNGAWLIWVVGTQSVAAAAAEIALRHPVQARGFAFLATAVWSLGVVLYLVVITLVTARLLLADLEPEQLSHPYWVTMGATAISVLTAARILVLQLPLPVPSDVMVGVTFLLWAFGSWWIPLLLVLGIWRHLVRRVPLVYHPSLWSMVFPLSMYATACQAFGEVAGIGALVDIARVEVWFAVAAWLLTFVGMLLATRRLFPSRTPAESLPT